MEINCGKETPAEGKLEAYVSKKKVDIVTTQLNVVAMEVKAEGQMITVQGICGLMTCVTTRNVHRASFV